MSADQLDQPLDDRELAIQSLKKRRDLRNHLFAYVVINGAFWGLWAIAGAGNLWPAWISGIWAVGVVFNVWDVYYGKKPITEADVQRETERLQHQH
jgi:hypothetical protein